MSDWSNTKCNLVSFFLHLRVRWAVKNILVNGKEDGIRDMQYLLTAFSDLDITDSMLFWNDVQTVAFSGFQHPSLVSLVASSMLTNYFQQKRRKCNRCRFIPAK